MTEEWEKLKSAVWATLEPPLVWLTDQLTRFLRWVNGKP